MPCWQTPAASGWSSHTEPENIASASTEGRATSAAFERAGAAVRTGNLEALDAELVAAPGLVDEHDANGHSLLALACRAATGDDASAVVRGSPQLHAVRRLLAAGADPNLADHDGGTPLHVAAMAGAQWPCIWRHSSARWLACGCCWIAVPTPASSTACTAARRLIGRVMGAPRPRWRSWNVTARRVEAARVMRQVPGDVRPAGCIWTLAAWRRHCRV